ncbi:MAG: NAD(P)H-hydrate dehydratase [Rhodothermales bacterium]
MQPVLTAEAMRAADRFAIETLGIPGFTLMESAGRAAADRIEATFGPLAGKTVACFCGKGNNGGDGFVVARALYARGARVRVVAMSAPEAMSEDAARNWHLLEHLAQHDVGQRLHLSRFENLGQATAHPAPGVYVDALLGTGLTNALREPLRGLVDWLNEQPQPIVALDVPTGLHSDRGTVLGTAVRADLTVTMGALKAGLVVGNGPTRSGRIETVDIGIPRFVIDRVREAPGCALLPTEKAIAAWLPRRAHDAHKYSVGLALVVGGAPGMTGAPVMASVAAARAGAGFVTCACPASIQPILAARLTEVTTLALPVTSDGGIQADGALDTLAPRLEKARTLLVGPGLGRHPDTRRFVHTLLQRAELPVVIDADGLNALAEDPDLIARHANGRWILTPHAGEFNRLIGGEVEVSDRIRAAQTYARAWNCVLILKGMPGIVGTPDGTAYINATGNAALATAGTGDVLAGLCAGLLAQGLAPTHAAVCALHLGGAAADRYARHYAPHTMMATDLLAQLPLVLKEQFSGLHER